MTLFLLRLTLLLHSALIGVQPIMAGYLLAGESDAFPIHSAVGSTLFLVAFTQIIVAFLFWWPGRGRFWPTTASAALMVLEITQLTLGHTQTLSVHIPLGVSLVVGVLLFTIWSFTPAAQWRRTGRSAKEIIR
jgi:hypothetical protein